MSRRQGGAPRESQFGAVVATALAEQGNARDEQDASGLDVVRERFQAAIGAFDPPALGGCRVVLVGGAASNLACLVRDAETYDHRLADRLREEAPGAYKDIGAVMKA